MNTASNVVKVGLVSFFFLAKFKIWIFFNRLPCSTWSLYLMNTVYCSAFQKVIPPVHSCFCFQTVQPRWKAGTHLNPFSIRFWQAVRFSVTGRSNISPWPDNGLYYRDTRVFGWMLHVWVTVYLVFREKISLSVISYTQMQCSPKLNSDRSFMSFTRFPLRPERPVCCLMLHTDADTTDTGW